MQAHPRKIGLITGATDGLGLEVSKKYAQAGFTVVMAGRNPAKLETGCTSSQSPLAPHVETVIFDLASLPSIRKGAQDFLDLGLPLHALITNARIQVAQREFTEDTQAFEKTIMVNMFGSMLLTELLVPRMRESGGGRILNTTSCLHDVKVKTPADPTTQEEFLADLDDLDGSQEWNMMQFYEISKFTDIWWTNVLATRLSADLLQHAAALTANSLCPGFVPTTDLGRHWPLWLRLIRRYITVWQSNAVTLDQSAQEYLAYGTLEEFCKQQWSLLAVW
ncbi:hypothetical protein BZG36_02053 [Bifiguratus adelaidae]|uniref:Ketoreductase (KR) domain-containing protein n=1 Tax=Bifiguratus adelaidae TaxID=1938954 RepID=A0A261Y1W4_9FUNG|nr:hypothetical protein BZG36_02053 [Bifiguratus adelaidae]